MPSAGGISAQFGMVDETTFGTSPVVTRFLEFNSETVGQTIARIDSSGLRVGRRVLRNTQWVVGRKSITGDIEFEVQQQGMGLLFKHAFGAVASSQPNVGSFPTVWEHTFTVGQLDGKSFTSQIAMADAGGVQRAFTYSGCKIPKWDLSCAVDGLLLFKPTIDGIAETSATAMAAATYAASSFPLMFSGATITLPSGAVGNINKFDLAGDNGLKTDRYFMGSTNAFTKKEQLEGGGLRSYSGSVDVEFDDLTAYNLFTAGTTGTMTAFFQGSNIAGTFFYSLEITMPAVRFDGSSPDVSGPTIVEMSLPYVALDDGGGTGGVQFRYRTTDTTP